MEVVARCHFLHDQLGRKEKGDKFTVTERQLKQLKDLKLIDVPVELYQTKVITDHPSLGRGEVQPLSASPAAQVLPQTTLPQSKRGRKRSQKHDESL